MNPSCHVTQNNPPSHGSHDKFSTTWQLDLRMLPNALGPWGPNYTPLSHNFFLPRIQLNTALIPLFHCHSADVNDNEKVIRESSGRGTDGPMHQQSGATGQPNKMDWLIERLLGLQSSIKPTEGFSWWVPQLTTHTYTHNICMFSTFFLKTPFDLDWQMTALMVCSTSLWVWSANQNFKLTFFNI